MTTKTYHSAMIQGIMVGSYQPYIVYGSVRGLVSEHRLLSAARRSAEKDGRDCSSLGGGAYSDAAVYCWDDEDGWQPDYTDE